MARERKYIQVHQTNGDTNESIVHSIFELNNGVRSLAMKSVGRAIEIQMQTVAKAYGAYISQTSNLGRLFFPWYGAFTPRSQNSPHEIASDRKRAASSTVKVAQHTAAHQVGTNKKTGSVGKRRAGSKRSRTKKGRAG